MNHNSISQVILLTYTYFSSTCRFSFRKSFFSWQPSIIYMLIITLIFNIMWLIGTWDRLSCLLYVKTNEFYWALSPQAKYFLQNYKFNTCCLDGSPKILDHLSHLSPLLHLNTVFSHQQPYEVYTHWLKSTPENTKLRVYTLVLWGHQQC